MKNEPFDKQEMIEYLKTECPESDEFSIEAAIYWFASDYHLGQSSVLYSILSTSPYRPSMLHNSVLDGEDSDIELYLLLKERYISHD